MGYVIIFGICWLLYIKRKAILRGFSWAIVITLMVAAFYLGGDFLIIISVGIFGTLLTSKYRK